MLVDVLVVVEIDFVICVIVLVGYESVFMVGNDFEDFMKNLFKDESVFVYQFLKVISRVIKLLIVFVSGVVVGVGMMMLLYCDFVYVFEMVKLLMLFVQLGFCLEVVLSLLLL